MELKLTKNYEKRTANHDKWPHLDISGRRYVDSWLAELVAEMGLDGGETPWFVHGLNSWIGLNLTAEAKVKSAK